MKKIDQLNGFLSLVLIIIMISGCDPVTPTDDDLDGYVTPDDCDDNNYDINPGVAEVCDDELDNDCDGDIDMADSNCGAVSCETTTDYIQCMDIPYKYIEGVDSNLLSLDVYTPKIDPLTNYPVLIYIHGGGWQSGDKSDVFHKDEYFTSKDFVFVSVNYRLTEVNGDHNGVMYPMHNQDVASAVKWVYDNIENYKGDKSNLIILGHSAGGGIGAAITTDRRFLEAEDLSLNNIKCMISLDSSGLNITERIENCYLMGQCERFYNSFSPDDEDLWYKASPINYIEPGIGIPTYFVITTGRTRLAYTEEFERALGNQVLHDYEVLNQYHHINIDTNLGESDEDKVTEEVKDFLDTYCVE
ncbi:carboxylesterase family protein [Nanoarchaeota archaeon]